jgi:hypothetical protein
MLQDKRVEFKLKWLLAAEPEHRPCLAPIGFRCNADDTPRFADWTRRLRLRAANDSGELHLEAEAYWLGHRPDPGLPANLIGGTGWAQRSGHLNTAFNAHSGGVEE